MVHIKKRLMILEENYEKLTKIVEGLESKNTKSVPKKEVTKVTGNK